MWGGNGWGGGGGAWDGGGDGGWGGSGGKGGGGWGGPADKGSKGAWGWGNKAPAKNGAASAWPGGGAAQKGAKAAPANATPLGKSATLAPPLGKAATLAPSGKAPVMARPAAPALGGKGALTPAKGPMLAPLAASPLAGKGKAAGKRNPNLPIRRILYIDDLEMPKRPDLPPRETDREVFLSRLPKDCTDEQLQDLIGGFGEIEDLHLIRDSFTTEFTGKGYVRFKTHKEALGCVQAHSDPDDKAEDDVIAKWSESERAQQKLRSVYCLDMTSAFCTAPGRLMPSLCQHAAVKEVFVTGEWMPKVGMMTMIAKTGAPKQLHFTAVVTEKAEETLRNVLSTALELFHEQVHTHLETDEGKEMLRKRAAGEEEAEEVNPLKKAKSMSVLAPKLAAGFGALMGPKAALMGPKAALLGGMGLPVKPPGKAPPREETIPQVFGELDHDKDKHLNEKEMQTFAHHVSVVFKDTMKSWKRDYSDVCSDGGADPATGVGQELFTKIVTDHSSNGIFLSDAELQLFLDSIICRRELIKAVFDACDKNGGGCLTSDKLRAFAGLTGFEGDEAEWDQEYTKLCKEQGVDLFAGVDHEAFSKIVNDQSDEGGCYCTDEELETMLKSMEKPLPETAAKIMTMRSAPKKGVIIAPPKKGSIIIPPKGFAGKMPTQIMPQTVKAKPKGPPPLDPGARKELCKQVFAALDKDKDEVLNAKEMKSFAVFTGFDGDDEVWNAAYKSLIEGHKGDVTKGIDAELFCVLMDDKNEETGCFCADGELKSVLNKILASAVRDDLVAKIFNGLDTDSDGKLNRQELRKFAEFGGFEGSEQVWAEEFDGIVGDAANKGPKDGVDLGFFKVIVNGESFGTFPDEELQNMLKKWAPMHAARPAGLLVPREQLIKSLYDALDADRDGKLNSREMQRFAEFGGFQGPESQWQNEFKSLVKEAGVTGMEVVDNILFKQLINDQSYETGMFTTDEEIVSMLSKLGLECKGETIDKADRTDLTAKLFNAIDQDKDGNLNSSEMRLFAETTGFVGSAEEWAEAFTGLCADGKRDPSIGVDPVYFSQMVNDKNEEAGTYCTNDELKESLQKVESGEVSKDKPKLGEAVPPEKAPVVVAPPEKVDPKRKAIIDEMFGLLDIDKDGKLNKAEMRKFAEQTGFDGSDEDWAEGYSDLCRDFAAGPDGISKELFTRLVNEENEESGCYCNDEELKTVFEALKAAKAG